MDCNAVKFIVIRYYAATMYTSHLDTVASMIVGQVGCDELLVQEEATS